MTDTTASTSRIKAIGELGQQIWLDNLSRELISSGALAAWIADDGIQGVTSNPSIFYNAIRSDAAYQAALPALRTAYTDPEARFEALVLPDVQRACDLFAPLYADSDGKAGFVSFEVSPRLAHDAAGTVMAARRLWTAIDRPNVAFARFCAYSRAPVSAGLVDVEPSATVTDSRLEPATAHAAIAKRDGEVAVHVAAHRRH